MDRETGAEGERRDEGTGQAGELSFPSEPHRGPCVYQGWGHVITSTVLQQ